MSRRVYERKFDWDHARELRAQGWTYQRIADELGVTPQGVMYALNADYRARAISASSAWQKQGTCERCGGQRSRIRIDDRYLCRSCASDDRATSVLPTLLKCGRCDSWLPDESFTSSKQARHVRRRGRRPHCRACETRARRERRRLYGWHK